VEVYKQRTKRKGGGHRAKHGDGERNDLARTNGARRGDEEARRWRVAAVRSRGGCEARWWQARRPTVTRHDVRRSRGAEFWDGEARRSRGAAVRGDDACGGNGEGDPRRRMASQ